MPLPKPLAQARTYAAWLAFLVVAHVATYLTDPYVFGFTVLGLAYASGVVVACGAFACLVALRSAGPASCRGVAASAALIVAANVAAFLVLRSFHWA